MISPGLAGVTCKFTVRMKATRILHEKTQRFLRGRWRTEEGLHFWKLHTWWMLRHGMGGVGCGNVGVHAYTWYGWCVMCKGVALGVLWGGVCEPSFFL